LSKALIGATGFVGQSLKSPQIAHHFHSRNIGQIKGQTFDTVFCAAAPGSMVEANTAPERDKARIDTLIEHLSRVRTEQFVLVSSIAVLADFAGQDDEDTQAFQTGLAYGRNRRALEVFCADHFDRCLILRLPALFGPGLKKNFLFDILNPVPTMLTPARMQASREAVVQTRRGLLADIYGWDETLQMYRLDRVALNGAPHRAALEADLKAAGLSAIGFTHPASTYQFYNLARLPADIEAACARGLDVLHLAVEPIAAAEIYEAVTGQQMLESDARIHHEDMRTKHAAIRGRPGPYLAERGEILEELRAFFDTARRAAA
jgi:hypothetical protein